jgi:hypothetical protein
LGSVWMSFSWQGEPHLEPSVDADGIEADCP